MTARPAFLIAARGPTAVINIIVDVGAQRGPEYKFSERQLYRSHTSICRNFTRKHDLHGIEGPRPAMAAILKMIAGCPLTATPLSP